MAVSVPQASDHSAGEFCMDTNCILRDTEKIYWHSTPNLVAGVCNERFQLLCAVHPIVAYHISTDICIAINHNNVLLVLSVYATCFSHVDCHQPLIYMTLKPKIKCIYTVYVLNLW